MWEYNYNYTDELYHHGIKGMKWGVRKSKNTVNKNYSAKQRKRDRAFYGNRAEKRINKKLNEGHGLQGARHYEVERKERIDKAKKTVKKGAKKAVTVMATLGHAYLTDQILFGGAGTKAAKTTIKYAGRAVVTTYMKARGATDIRWYDN